METINLIRFIVGCIFILLGVFTFIVENLGVNRLKYILNRMHFAGAGDTCGLGFTIIGVVFINGLDFASLKLLLVVVFLWFSSPVSSHLISRLIRDTDENLKEHVKILDEEESKKYIEE